MSYARLCGFLETAEGVTLALKYLYAKQLDFEKAQRESVIINDRGFSSFDAKYGSYCADFCIKTGRLISGNHLAKWQGKRIGKYWRQLLDSPEFMSLVP